MTLNLRHAFLSVLYALALSWLLIYEIVPRWGYMNYAGEFSGLGLSIALWASVILGLSVPRGKDARAMMVASLNYMFFVPYAVYISFSPLDIYHYISFSFCFIGIYYLSRVRVPAVLIAPIRQDRVALVALALLLGAISAQAAFGGLRYFSLNIGRVYEFRALAAEQVPALFGYVFSGVSNVLIPLALISAIKNRRYLVASIVIFCSVILFGMTHHKSVLFIPIIVIVIYICFYKPGKTYLIGVYFIGISLFCALEVIFVRYIMYNDQGIAYLTSYIIRRVLFTPVMLDTAFVDFFSNNAKYYWSSSRFGSWAFESPYPVAAPGLIGDKYFSNPGMSANTGMIGSGFANAGLYGVFLYSLLVGALISVLNEYGRRIGHAMVAAVGLVTVFYVVTTTDLTTAILSHGLLLLLVVLALFSGPMPKHRGTSALVPDRLSPDRAPL